MNTNKTIILSSSRAIRHKQLQTESNSLFLPNYMTMSEFISRLCIVKNFTTIDKDTRVLYLLEASNYKKFSNLKIERNFFTFVKNSSYIFNFFEEISAELFDIKNLNTSDIFGEYEEHIEILQELYDNYEQICLKNRVLDKIFLPKLYSFNDKFVSSHKNIELHIDGYITNFEFELLFKSTKFSNISIYFNTSKYNKKMQNKFEEIGIELEIGFRYKLSLNSKKILEKERLKQNKSIECKSFSEPLLQVAFIKQKIYEYVNAGYKAQKIAVVLPDEKMAQMLRSFDTKSNFNFAMGEPFSNTPMYQKLNANIKYIEEQSKENLFRIDRLGDELYMELKKIYFSNSYKKELLDFLRNYQETFSNKVHIKIFLKELYDFEKLLYSLDEISTKNLLRIFMQRLAQKSIDDVRGGKITVMGVLETRSIDFDAVIIVDFSDVNVPRRNDKDMFLNTNIREMASLPTMNDRENLQKHYYYSLMGRCSELAISYVLSSESYGSNFLKQQEINTSQVVNEDLYANILFKKTNPEQIDTEEIIMKYSFKNVNLSATKLKIFLTCKRRYYLKYIKNLKSHITPQDTMEEWEIGTSVHKALKNLYDKKQSYKNRVELKKDLNYELDEVVSDNELDKFLINMQKRKLDNFCKNEINRFNDGWSVAFREQSETIEYAGMKLIGQIDRIDKREHHLEVIDYKTGKYPTQKQYKDSKDFQLEFYYLLSQKYGDVLSCYYYDLKKSILVKEEFLKEKLDILKSHISNLLDIKEINFKKCEDVKNCEYCEFKIICEIY